ncbi:MAG: trypsin-like peptidase domain-containing protein [Planctomycetes bacterium]|nr:trypsin-like peptidase domain-containing protein [Planctomycetota bacterium]
MFKKIFKGILKVAVEVLLTIIKRKVEKKLEDMSKKPMNHSPDTFGRGQVQGKGKVIRLLIILIAGILLIGLTAWSTKPAELPSGVIIIRPMDKANNPYQREYDEMLSPTVMIETLTGCGSGVVIATTDEHGYTLILTAGHVVGNYAKVSVTFFSYRKDAKDTEIDATVVITDTVKDLALLSVLCDFAVKTANLAPKDYVPYLFAPVYVVGCSLGLSPRPSSGIISVIGGFSWEITAPVLPGNSGGPVYAKRSAVPSNDGNAYQYELIGIAVWVRLYGDQLITTMAGIVPISEIYDFLDQRTEGPRKRTKEPKDERTLNSSYVFPFLSSSVRQSDASRCLSVSMHGKEMYRRAELTRKTEDSFMPNILFDVKLEIPASYAPAGDIAEKWAKNLGENAELLIDRLQRAIPDEASYQEKLSTPAAEQWPSFMSDTYRTKRGRVKASVVKTFAKNIQDAYQNWVTRVTRVFEEIGGVKAKRFVDAVNDSKERVAESWRKKALRITGDRIHGIGAAAIACFWMTGEPTVAGKLRQGDQLIAGAPYRICREEFIQSFRSALMGRLIQAGMLISNAEYSTGSISAQNTVTNNLVQGMIDPALGLMSFIPGGDSCVDFMLEDGIFKLRIKATQV